VPEPTGEQAGAGVDIAAGDSAVARIRDLVASTARPEVLGGIGGFGGSFAFDTTRYRHPVLVSSTDGVGTKSYVAAAAGRYDTIGIDLVAMCVDDMVCEGAEPLFMLDYISVGDLDAALQTKLLRVLQDGRYERVGGTDHRATQVGKHVLHQHGDHHLVLDHEHAATGEAGRVSHVELPAPAQQDAASDLSH